MDKHILLTGDALQLAKELDAGIVARRAEVQNFVNQKQVEMNAWRTVMLDRIASANGLSEDERHRMAVDTAYLDVGIAVLVIEGQHNGDPFSMLQQAFGGEVQDAAD